MSDYEIKYIGEGIEVPFNYKARRPWLVSNRGMTSNNWQRFDTEAEAEAYVWDIYISHMEDAFTRIYGFEMISDRVARAVEALTNKKEGETIELNKFHPYPYSHY